VEDFGTKGMLERELEQEQEVWNAPFSGEAHHTPNLKKRFP